MHLTSVLCLIFLVTCHHRASSGLTITSQERWDIKLAWIVLTLNYSSDLVRRPIWFNVLGFRLPSNLDFLDSIRRRHQIESPKALFAQAFETYYECIRLGSRAVHKWRHTNEEICWVLTPVLLCHTIMPFLLRTSYIVPQKSDPPLPLLL